MSLTISLRLQALTGNSDEPVHSFEVLNENVAHNLRDLWAYLDVYKILYESHDQLVSDKWRKLQAAVYYMEKFPEECKRFDAPNGCGTYRHALKFLRTVAEAFAKFPFAIISVSR